MSIPDIFISYKRQEQATARNLAEALSAAGWDVWWDPELRAGEHFDQVIEKALAESRCVIVLWSTLSIASQYVRDEASYALEQKKLVPLWLEQVELPFRFRGLHTLNFTGWSGDTSAPVFSELVEDITSRIGPPGDPKPLPPAEPGADGKRPGRRIAYVAAALLAIAGVGASLLWNDRRAPDAENCLVTIAIEAIAHEREALTLVARGGDWTRSFPVSDEQTTIEIPAAHTGEWRIDVVWDGDLRSRFGGNRGFSGCSAVTESVADDGSARISITPL